MTFSTQGFRKIDFQRFNYECSICGKQSTYLSFILVVNSVLNHLDVGSTVPCEKSSCKKRFHPECARKANLSLETKEIEVTQMCGSFLVAEPQEVQVIYCEKHRPLKLKGHLESRDKKEREEIYKFCKVIEKTYQINVAEQNAFKESLAQQQQQEAAAELAASTQSTKKKNKPPQPEMEIDPWLKQVEELKKKIPTPQHLIYLERKEAFAMHPETNEPMIAEYFHVTNTEVIMPDPHRKLTSKDEIWNYIEYKDFNALQKFNRYRRLRKATASTTAQKETSDFDDDFEEEEEILPKKVSRRYMKSTTSLAQKSNKLKAKAEETEQLLVKNEPQPLQPVKSKN